MTIGLGRYLFAVSHDEEHARAVRPARARHQPRARRSSPPSPSSSPCAVVGLLLISALMIIPVATAQLVARSFRRDHGAGDGPRHRVRGRRACGSPTRRTPPRAGPSCSPPSAPSSSSPPPEPSCADRTLGSSAMCMQCVAEGVTYVGGAVGALQVLKVRARGADRRRRRRSDPERTDMGRTPTTTTDTSTHARRITRSRPARPGGCSAASWRLVAVVAVIGGLVLRPDAERPVLGEELGFTGELVHATATHVRTIPCRGTAAADGIPCDHVEPPDHERAHRGRGRLVPDQRHRLGGGDPRRAIAWWSTTSRATHRSSGTSSRTSSAGGR